MTGYIGSRNLVLEEKIRSEKMVEEELERNGKSFLQPFVIGKMMEEELERNGKSFLQPFVIGKNHVNHMSYFSIMRKSLRKM